MAKSTKNASTDAPIELIFDGVSWIDPNAPSFDFDSFEFDGCFWIPKKA